MTERKNIVDGMQAPNLNYGLVYTKKCGWVDLGHANPVGGASVLWDNIRYEKGKSSTKAGYHRIVYSQKTFLQICEPVSKEEALTIWDTYGSVDSNKNYTIVPYIYPTSFSKNLGPMSSQLPPMLRTIKPANQGVLFYEVK